MSYLSKYRKAFVPRTTVSLFVLALVLPSLAYAGPVTLFILPGTYRITNGQGAPPELVSSGDLVPNGQPAGSTFTFAAGPPGYIVITSTNSKFEPTVQKLAFAPAAPGGTFTIGVTADFPGEQGYAALDFTGLIADASAGGSTISVGLVGGDTASYTTTAGDTFETVFDNLLSELHGDGIDAYQMGDDLVVLSNISNPNTLAGAVDFTSDDPNLAFDAEAGTLVPEPSSLTMVLSGFAGILGYGWRRRSMRG